jgi:hypothetical protein
MSEAASDHLRNQLLGAALDAREAETGPLINKVTHAGGQQPALPAPSPRWVPG